MKYAIYQIQLSNAQYDLINAEGHDSVHKQSMKLDMGLRKNDTGAVAKEAFDLGYYTHVSNIDAYTLEGVFHVGNMGPETDIERLSRMSSISVGDIIEDENGKQSVVANYGFQEVSK
jgi:hypothetical protein